MHYEVGKTYRVNGKIALCSNGLHFCERLKDVFSYYPKEEHSRYFEVYAGGQIVCGDDKSAASELTIIRELTNIEVNRCMYGNGYGDGYGYGNGYGDGYGYGNGYGNGDGYGDGNGYGDGYGNGYGYGYGDGYGYGNGYGYGDGNGYGDGYGDGYGYGNGYGYGIQRIAIYKN